ncbi:pilus assembly protein TadG-related protein [Antribacter gilvus]|uniref:pilus assembly protein TadG-related protein n=1 Tax=Antribacter gilvus TaxID=2304675 RepID=UPI0013DF2F13|nr:pilus assembly protein TadG-related protein [Antribacter gilvus]
MGILSVAILVIVMVGSATDDRRRASAAADAAALAAAQEWDGRLKGLHGLHLGAGEHSTFWQLAGLPVEESLTYDAMAAAASDFAARNGAELTDLDVDPGRLEVTASVRHLDTVPRTDVRQAATATARIELSGGLCLDGGRLGWEVNGTCLSAPPPEPTPSPSPTDPAEPPSPEPTFSPPSVMPFESDVVLVD